MTLVPVVPRRYLIAVAAALALLLLMPALPAQAACDWDRDTFASGSHWKYSTSSFASSGTCNDVNIYDVQDSDGSNGETREYRGYWYNPTFAEWIGGTLGYVDVTEGAPGLDVALTDVVTGTEYKYRSQQSGGVIDTYD